MKKTIIILTIIFLVIPFLSLASLGLEETYPKLPGSGQTISVNSSLGDTVRYFVSWSIILGAIIAFGALVAGGIVYLTSAGDPNKMNSAKDKIVNSLLGLVILFSSYLVLVTVNPQLTVLEVEEEPISLGVILFNEDQSNGPTTMQDLNLKIKSGDIRYLNQSVPDAEKEFGKIISGKFSKFNVKSIGFFKEGRNKIKVVAFKEKEFKGTSNEYSFDGLLDVSTGSVEKPGQLYLDGRLKLINIEKIGGNFPLSFNKIYSGPGVYLFAKNKGEQIRLTDNEYPKLKPLKFNDKAYYVKIKNDIENDHLAILYEDEYFGGPLRLFFQKEVRKPNNSSSSIYGNTTENKFTAIRNNKGVPFADKYGAVKEVSSVQIFKIDESGSSCKEVRLCTEPEFSGSCLVFLGPGNTIDMSQEEEGIGISLQSLPIYRPRKLTLQATDKIDAIFKEGNSTTTKKIKYEDNINSILIDGDCAVVLFENSPDKFNDPYVFGPGKHSQVFTESNPDLSDERITGCGKIKGLGFIWSHSCVSGIAIFPIKR